MKKYYEYDKITWIFMSLLHPQARIFILQGVNHALQPFRPANDGNFLVVRRGPLIVDSERDEANGNVVPI